MRSHQKTVAGQGMAPQAGEFVEDPKDARRALPHSSRLRVRAALSDYLLAVGFYLALNVVVFHGGLFGLVCRVDSYAGNVYARMAVLKATETESNRRVVALLGDSTTEEGIDAKALTQLTGEPAVNLALPGTGSLEWLPFLKSIDPDRDRFDTLVLTISPQVWRSQANDDGIQTLIPVATVEQMIRYVSTRKASWSYADQYYAAFDRIYAFRRDLRDLAFSPGRLFFNGESRKAQESRIRNWEGEEFDVCSVRVDPKRGKILDWGSIKDEKIRSLAKTNVQRVFKLNRKPAVSGLFESLEATMSYYDNSKTKIVVVSIPFGFGHEVPENSRHVGKYLDQMNRLIAGSGVRHWNAFNEEVFKDCKHFYDFRHLNATGRRIFTARLAEELKK